MARTAIALGHDYMVLTDHSPRLTVAHGLESRAPARPARGDRASSTNELAPFRILTGMEVDILEDGTLDLDDDLLAQLDVVVGSVHSKLRMDRREMTRRMVLAVSSPHVDILGHCTGRKLRVARRAGGLGPRGGRGRRRSSTPRSCSPPVPASTPPSRSTAGPNARTHPTNCSSSRSSGAARSRSTPTPTPPARLEWQLYGCEKAARHEIDIDQIVNTWAADDLLEWAAHPSPPSDPES